MTSRHAIALVISVAAAGLVFYMMFRTPQPLREAPLHEVASRFLTILPSDLSEEKRSEIEGLMKRFQAKADVGKIRAEDYQEVMLLFTKYLKKGAITEKELHLVMARVGYYSHRTYSEDSTLIHPLLEPVEPQAPDSTHHDHR